MVADILGNNKMVSNLAGVEESKSSSLQPCLLITVERKSCDILTNMFNNEPELLYDVGGEIPEFLGRRIASSFGEWVHLSRTRRGNNLPEVLVNMLSKEIIELPVLDFTYSFCILTSHPHDPNCHILYFSKEEKTFIFCKPGDKEYTIRKWAYEFFPSGARAVVAGKLFLALPSVLGVIEFKESTYGFELIKMDRGIRPIVTAKPLFFEYSGELFIVYRIKCGNFPTSTLSGIEIFKADFLNKRWVSVKSLGRLAIFIGYGYYGTAAYVQCGSVESGIKANSIYFLEQGYPDIYYIYNLEDGTIRMKPIFSSMEMESREVTQLYWIMMPSKASFRTLLKGDQKKICHDSENENKASGEVEEVGVQNSWNTVPPELLNLIQLHLFERDDVVFRVVCKAWQQASSIQDHSIPALLSSTTFLELCQSSSPLLMFQEDLTISDDSVPIFRFFDPVHKKLYRTEIPELRETDIHYSKDGWLLVSRRSDGSIFFFNPLTQEKIELPRMPLDSYFSAHKYYLSFSSLPTCSNCLVVANNNDDMSMYTLIRGKETWRHFDIVGFEKRKYVCSPVVHNGYHHFMCENRDVVVLYLMYGLEGYRYCYFSLSKFERLQYEYFFLEIDGALAFVSIEPDGGEMKIFKLNELGLCWKLMEGGVDFGGKAMFLSKRGSFLEKIDDGGGIRNTIFLPMVDDAKEGVFYSQATQRYHTLYSGYSSELPYNVDKILNGIWVKPYREIVGDSNLSWFL